MRCTQHVFGSHVFKCLIKHEKTLSQNSICQGFWFVLLVFFYDSNPRLAFSQDGAHHVPVVAFKKRLKRSDVMDRWHSSRWRTLFITSYIKKKLHPMSIYPQLRVNWKIMEQNMNYTSYLSTKPVPPGRRSCLLVASRHQRQTFHPRSPRCWTNRRLKWELQLVGFDMNKTQFVYDYHPLMTQIQVQISPFRRPC